MYPYSKIESNAVLQFNLSIKKHEVALLHIKVDETGRGFIPISLYTIDQRDLEELRRKTCLKNRKLYSWKILSK